MINFIEVATIATGVIAADFFMRYVVPWYEGQYRKHIDSINKLMVKKEG